MKEQIECEDILKHPRVVAAYWGMKGKPSFDHSWIRGWRNWTTKNEFAVCGKCHTATQDYYEESLRLLRSGGVIAVDNVLWSGRVLKPEGDDTKAIHALNEKIVRDERVEAVLVTVRDGVQLVRKL